MTTVASSGQEDRRDRHPREEKGPDSEDDEPRVDHVAGPGDREAQKAEADGARRREEHRAKDHAEVQHVEDRRSHGSMRLS